MDSPIISEANILIDISFVIKQKYRTNVTIIPLTQTKNIMDLLARGPVIIFQFNKPYPYSSDRNNNYTKFIINTEQHRALLQVFKPNQAFYIFVALNTVSEIISNRKDIMKYCIAVDIHSIPNGISLHQKTRVIRMVKSSLSPKLEIAESKKFQAISNIVLIQELCRHFVEGLAGIATWPLSVPITSFMDDFEGLPQHMYILHLGTESAAAS